MIRLGREGRRRRNSSSSNSDNETVEKVKFITAYDDDTGPSASNLKIDNFPLKFDTPGQSEEGQRLL